MITPMPNSSTAITMPDPRAEAANASGLSRARRKTSVELIRTMVTLVSTNGHANAKVARNSSRHGDGRLGEVAWVVMGRLLDD